MGTRIETYIVVSELAGDDEVRAVTSALKEIIKDHDFQFWIWLPPRNSGEVRGETEHPELLSARAPRDWVYQFEDLCKAAVREHSATGKVNVEYDYPDFY